jgi:hypothetical protein
VSRVVVFRNDTNPAGIAVFSVIQAMATSAGLQVTPVSVRNSDEIACHRRRGDRMTPGRMSAFGTKRTSLAFGEILRRGAVKSSEAIWCMEIKG